MEAAVLVRHPSPSGPVSFALATALASLTSAIIATAAEPTKQECVLADEAAQPLRRSGKLRDARAELQLCVSAACPGPVRDDCAQRLDDVNKALPTVVFVVRAADGRDLTAVRVTVDGALLAEQLDGSALPIDPGEHTCTFEADGFARADLTILLREGDKQQRQRVTLQPAGGPASRPIAHPNPAPLRAATTTQSPPSWAKGTGASKPWPAYVALGVGAVGVVVTTVFGVLAIGNKSSLDSACGSDKKTCPGSSQPDINALHSNALVSDVGLGVGIVGVLVGTVLLLVNGGSSGSDAREKATAVHVAPSFGPGTGSVRVSF